MIKDDSEALRALVEALREVSAKLPAAEEYVMVHHPAFRVGKKPFAIAGLGREVTGSALSINLGRDMQHQLLEDPRFVKTPYIGQHGWVTVQRSELRKDELVALVTHSWRRVANQKQLAQLDPAPAAARNTAQKKSRVEQMRSRERAAASRGRAS